MIPIRDALRTERFPVVTVALIVLNLLVFLYQGYLETRPAVLNDMRPWTDAGLTAPAFSRTAYSSHVRLGGDPWQYPLGAGDAFVLQFGLVPAEFSSGVDFPPLLGFPIWLALFTSMFLHGGLLHVLGNMLYLWVFGDNVENAMGRGRFLVFYILCGCVAGLAQLALSPHSAVPLIGASGAIAGVLGAYLMLFPRSRILTVLPIFFFIRLVTIPAVVVLGIWFVLQVINSAASFGAAGGVAWFAHIGGFAAGMALVLIFRTRGTPLGLVDLLRRRASE